MLKQSDVYYIKWELFKLIPTAVVLYITHGYTEGEYTCMFNNKSVWFATAIKSNMQCNVSNFELCGYFLNDSTIYTYIY